MLSPSGHSFDNGDRRATCRRIRGRKLLPSPLSTGLRLAASHARGARPTFPLSVTAIQTVFPSVNFFWARRQSRSSESSNASEARNFARAYGGRLIRVR